MPTTRYKTAKYAVYTLLTAVFFLLQSTPGVLSFFGVKPMLVIGAAVCVAMAEGELAGGIFAIYAGLLCDLYGYDAFGYYALALFVCCVGIGVLTQVCVQPVALSAVLFTLGVTLAAQGVAAGFQAMYFNYEGVGRLYLTHILPVSACTGAFALPVWWLVKRVHRFFAAYIDD